MKTTGCWVFVFGFFLTLAFPPLAMPQDAALTATRTVATNLVQDSALRAVAPQWRAKNRNEHQTEWFSVRYITNAGIGRVRGADGKWQPAHALQQASVE